MPQRMIKIMSFFKQFIENEIVYIINDKIIKDSLIENIVHDINTKHKIGLDMKNVKALNSSLFLKYLKGNRYKLYNISNEVLTYLSIVLKDGKLKSYMNFKDFKYNKRELIRRRFSIV